MWRQNLFPDSDQSISDEEEFDRVTYDHGCLESLRSLCEKGKKELEVAPKLEMLREQFCVVGGHKLNLGEGTSTFIEKLGNFKFEADEMREIQNEDEFDDEGISDEEESSVLSKFSFSQGASMLCKSHPHDIDDACQLGNETWSTVLKETDELVYMHEKFCCSTHAANFEARRFPKANISNAKLKFSIRSGAQDESSSKNTQLLGVSGEPVHRVIEQSMSELLEDLQEKNGSSRGISTMNGNSKERWFQLPRRRVLYPLSIRIPENEDPFEPIDSGISSEDEETCKNQLSLCTRKAKCQTMVERFQDAFTHEAADDKGLLCAGKQTGIGYYGRLQKIMHKEKERHIEFLKRSQIEVSSQDELPTLDVQILSRYLDAKLIVCYCSLGDINKVSQSVEPDISSSGVKSWKRTIVFSPRVCGNVELEVGSMIRIFPPWRTVQVMPNESIILCTYFSQIS